jgi:hypothetical protein
MSEAQQPECRTDTNQDGDESAAIEARAWHALQAARDALQSLVLLWEGEKSDAVSGIVDTVDQAIDDLEAMNG